MILWSARAEIGPLSPPGNYSVRLTVDGQSQTQRFAIRKDPRLTNVPDADLVEQFDLAMKVRDKTSEANQMVILIRDVKKQITERSEKSRDRAVIDAGRSFSQKLTAIEEEVYQVRNRSNQDPLNFPIKLNNQIAALRRSIETGDGRPTSQSYVVFKELSAQLDVLRVKLNGLIGSELAQLNKLLAQQNLEPIRTSQSVRSEGPPNTR
jgi:hypothetical protein